MKTSNKLLFTAILIIIGSMVTYDLALRAEYRKGTYKSRFYGMGKITGLKKFTSIDNRAANLISVQVESGNDYGIWVKNDWKDRIKISSNGSHLVIGVVGEKNPFVNSNENSIIIICSTLDQVITTPFFTSKDNENNSNYSGTTTLIGFNQQKLTLQVNKATNIFLGANKIEQLQASIGDNSSRNAHLTIGSNNQINIAEIKVAGRNELNIQNAKIKKSNFNISDSAQVNLSGSSLNHIIK